MNELYIKNKLSQTKFRKIERDYIDGKIGYFETGEIPDILNDKREVEDSYVNLKYSFSFYNRDFMDLYKGLGATNFGHLRMLIDTMTYKNVVRFDKLGIGKSGIKKLKFILQRKGIVKYYEKEYYMNPAISSYNRKVSVELVKLFEEINDKKFYIKL